jgi:PilZ domain-containing protein
MTDDKRHAKRVSYPCEVECTGAGANPLNPRISDLSSSGAFIDSMMAVPVGTHFVVSFTLPSGPIQLEAEVVHSMEHFGMGVRFLGTTGEQVNRLEAAVQSRD